jgi:hypothetical protein
MKKALFGLFLLGMSSASLAQNTFPATGNVGIGTTSPSTYPGYSVLTLDNSTTGSIVDLKAGGAQSAMVLGEKFGMNLFAPAGKLIIFCTDGGQKMVVLANGNVGIGSAVPQARLEVAPPSGSTAAGVFHLTGSQAWGNVATLATDNSSGDDARLLFSYRNKSKQWSLGGSFNTTRFGIWEDSGEGTYGSAGYGTERLTVLPGGNVGIGVVNPANKLDVNGTIHSQAVKIDMSGWSDYVFNNDYKLRTLKEVKSYIDVNHHLPDAPSANEIEKSGLDVGEMNKLLMKKVEELTLYLIEADKKQKNTEEKVLQLETSVKVLNRSN